LMRGLPASAGFGDTRAVGDSGAGAPVPATCCRRTLWLNRKTHPRPERHPLRLGGLPGGCRWPH
jgi:hypothetical protein